MTLRKTFSLPDLYSGSLEVRLARSENDLKAAQRLRYQVFCDELGASINDKNTPGYDQDFFDSFCDHLLVIDQAEKPENSVVGTYRLLRKQPAELAGRFYSADEYDISPLLKFPGEILELGRSCVKQTYRTRATMQLLWRGIAAYASLYGIDLLFGCASFPGTDLTPLKKPLSYLFHYHLAPIEIRPKALSERWINMNIYTKEEILPDLQKYLTLLPPLIKGYIRVGGFVGDGAVFDHTFNTTDICVILRMDLVTGRYDKRFIQKQASE